MGQGTQMLQSLRSFREMPRVVIMAMLALALLVRLAVPAGWMPVSDAHGTRLTICTGTGPLDAPSHAPKHMMATPGGAGMHHAPGDHPHDGGTHVCPFTGVALALTQPVLPALALSFVVTPGVAALPHVAMTVGRGLAAPPPPATGPPARV